MRKPPIFLDKPIAGAIIRQTDRQTDRQADRQTDRQTGRQAALSLSIFAAQNFITHQQGALRPWIFHGCGALFCVRRTRRGEVTAHAEHRRQSPRPGN